jgi:hypothetical protein
MSKLGRLVASLQSKYFRSLPSPTACDIFLESGQSPGQFSCFTREALFCWSVSAGLRVEIPGPTRYPQKHVRHRFVGRFRMGQPRESPRKPVGSERDATRPSPRISLSRLTRRSGSGAATPTPLASRRRRSPPDAVAASCTSTSPSFAHFIRAPPPPLLPSRLPPQPPPSSYWCCFLHSAPPTVVHHHKLMVWC